MCSRAVLACRLIPFLLTAVTALAQSAGSGELRIVGDQKSEAAPLCPLKHTDVRADIAGFIARTTVHQVFQNPSDRKIEAVYVFPLPQDAAVDDMTLIVGEHRIVGQIHRREEAREIYEQAVQAGHVAGLLDQERPNIFTQSVANIEPGAEVSVEISYTEVVKYDDGLFQWTFPMVVGPRYIPGGGSAPAPRTKGTPTGQVPDADRITPPVTPQGTRAGHDISLTVSIDGGSPRMRPAQIESILHDVQIENARCPGCAIVSLKDQNEIPNRDFILRYRLGDDALSDAFLVHNDARGSFFALVLQPPKRVVPAQVMPRELIFVLDTSGSMHGFPLESAKKLMSGLIDTMQPADTFNIITFSGDTHILWEQPRPNSAENRAAAQKFLESRSGSGGTEMMKAIDAALTRTRGGPPRPLSPSELIDLPADGRQVRVLIPYEGWSTAANTQTDGLAVPVRDDVELFVTPALSKLKWEKGAVDCPTGEPVLLTGKWSTAKGQRVLEAKTASYGAPRDAGPIRVVCFLTDGYVGNDMEIIGAVKKNADTTRVFSFGVGNGVNRFLLDGMAAAGRGEAEYVTLAEQAEPAVQRFQERLLAPVLTDIQVDWGNLPVADVLPARIPDLFSAKPVVVFGRLTGPVSGAITLHGNTGAGPCADRIELSAPADAADHEALATLWARMKVGDLMMQDMTGLQRGTLSDALKNEMIDLGLKYRLMTQFTSFVAVEQMRITAGGAPVTIDVPVEMPQGVSYQGVFGEEQLRLGFAGQTRSAGRQVGGAPAATAAPQLAPARAGSSAGKAELRAAARGDAGSLDGVEEKDEAAAPKEPAQRLAEALRGLAARVEKEGKSGDLKIGNMIVSGYRVDVMIALRDLSDKTLAALQQLGFEKSAQSSAARLLIGSIDVRKLDELSRLDALVSVRPVVAP